MTSALFTLCRWAQAELAQLEREMHVSGRMPAEAYIRAAAPARAAPAPAAPVSRTAALVASAAAIAAVAAAAGVPAAYASGALRRGASSAHLHDWLGGEEWWRAAALRAFAKLDREACGTLGAADVVAYCRSHANGLFLGAQQPLLADRGSPLARGVERALVAAVDMDGDGRIDLNEFAGMLWRVRRRRRGLLRVAFFLGTWAAHHHRGAPHPARASTRDHAVGYLPPQRPAQTTLEHPTPTRTPGPHPPHVHCTSVHAHCTAECMAECTAECMAECIAACGSAPSPPARRVARRDDAVHATGRGEAPAPLVAPHHPPMRRACRATRRRAPRHPGARG